MDAGPTDGTRRTRTPTETRHTDSMTDHATDTDRRGIDDRPTLAETDHTNPYTDEVFGATQMYSRGRTVAADGGEPNDERRSSSELWSDGDEANSESRASSELWSDGGERGADPRANGIETGTAAHDEEEEEEEETADVATMADVAHEPPGDADGAQAAYDRGVRDE